MNTGITEGRGGRRGEERVRGVGLVARGSWSERQKVGEENKQTRKPNRRGKKITREKEKTHEYTVKKERIVSDGLLP